MSVPADNPSGAKVYFSVSATDDVNGTVQARCIPYGNDFAVGGIHSCALLGDGTVDCWGWNNIGQLGNDTHTNSNEPVGVFGLS